MRNLNKINNLYLVFFSYIKGFLFWSCISALLGAVCGIVGFGFARSISFVTDLRAENGWLLFLLPILPMLSVLIYKLCKVEGVGTNQILTAVQTEKQPPILLLPAIFLGSVMTHLCGGSAGKEGAALQIGGSISALFSKLLRLREGQRRILTICGMGGLFAAVFGTPLGACVFALEVASVGQIASSALLPTAISCLTAFKISTALGLTPDRFSVSQLPKLNLSSFATVIFIAIIGAVVSIVFCKSLHISERLFKKYFKNPYFRIFIGGIIIILLTLIVGSYDYNGSGIHIMEEVFATGKVRPEAFILKIIFTAITVGAGFKGGEIVPTMFIGVALGGVIGMALGLNVAFCAAIGLISLLCGATNCPLAIVILSAELFGGDILPFALLASFTSFVLLGNGGLYSSQKFIFSRIEK